MGRFISSNLEKRPTWCIECKNKSIHRMKYSLSEFIIVLNLYGCM